MFITSSQWHSVDVNEKMEVALMVLEMLHEGPPRGVQSRRENSMALARGTVVFPTVLDVSGSL